MRSLRTAAVSLGAAALLAAGLIPAAAAPSAKAYSCSAGYFCMYSDWNGGGTRCQYREKTPNTADHCSFIRDDKNVKSVYNRHDDKATYYTQTNYKARVGSTRSQKSGNLQGDYQIRSIKF